MFRHVLFWILFNLMIVKRQYDRNLYNSLEYLLHQVFISESCVILKFLMVHNCVSYSMIRIQALCFLFTTITCY